MEMFDKIMFLDLETTGDDKAVNGVHEIAAIFDIGGNSQGEFNKKVRYHPFAQINPKALELSGVTQSDIMRYPLPDVVYRELVLALAMVVDQTNPQDKLLIAGYNSGEFDKPFFKVWWMRYGSEKLFKAFFHSISLDIAALAIQYMKQHKIRPLNLSLCEVAIALDIPVDRAQLHKGEYDVKLARSVYKRITQ